MQISHYLAQVLVSL